MPLRRIVFDAVVVGLVVAMVIARLRSASGPTRVLKPVEERSPWRDLRDLRERLLNLHRDEPGVRAVVVAFALAIAGAAWISAPAICSPAYSSWRRPRRQPSR